MAPGADAALETFYSDVGRLRLSVDATGTNGASSVVEVEKPPGATVRKAFLFAASTGFSGFGPGDGAVTIDGADVAWDPSRTLTNGISSVNVAADVTGMVRDKIDSASAGRIGFEITEPSSTRLMDGEILAVVFDDPAVATNTIYLMYGAQSTSGDEFALGLSAPLKPSATAQLGLGISFGFQPGGQYSEIDVNGTRLTTSAGGQDDGVDEDGGLITVGGLDDSPANPADPLATTCDEAPRCDDELYDVKPLVPGGSTSIDIDTLNPSADDNIFFAAINLGAASGVVGDGAVVTPTGTTTQVGYFHFMSALVQDEQGSPVSGENVTLEIVDGPGEGYKMNGVTNGKGKASFNYTSTATGTDTLVATYEDGDGVTHTSTPATHKWIPAVNGTFGGAWPFSGNILALHWSYGGAHRYLGNAFQGAANWNAAGTNVQMSQWPGAPYAVHLPFVDVRMRDDWYGMVVFADDCGNCGYTRTVVQMNQTGLDPESDAQRTKVATHELGHALGLKHPSGYAADSVPSVMWQGRLGGHTTQKPQAFDTNRVNALYP